MNNRLKELRSHLNMSLEDFGTALGVTRAAVSRWENGERGISNQAILSICREFNVSERWLRTGEGEMFEQTRETVLDRLAAEYSLDKEQVSVIENFLDLSPQERTLFLTQMRKVFGGPAAQPPRRVDVSDDVAAAVANAQDEVARYNAEQADEAASGGKEFSSTG